MSKSRYDFIIPLFGRENDNRVRLFLDILFDTKLAPWNNDAEILKTKNFEGGSGDTVSEEWNTFFADIKYRLANYNPTKGAEAVRRSALEPMSLVKAFAVELTKALFVVPEDATQWTLVSTVSPKTDAVSSRLMGPTPAGSSDSNRFFFNYKLDKYVISVFLEAAARNSAQGSATFFEEKNEQ